MNFGERIAYWYLRLNGFLLVEDFVLHQDGARRTADADLLGVRLAHSQEHINGALLEADRELAERLHGFGRNTALLVQVKTGARSEAGSAFAADRLRYGLAFLGCAAPDRFEALAEELERRATVQSDGWTIAKLLIADQPADDRSLNISLDSALRFIHARLAQHSNRKVADRMFFPDELMQYFAWRAGQVRAEDGR